MTFPGKQTKCRWGIPVLVTCLLAGTAHPVQGQADKAEYEANRNYVGVQLGGQTLISVHYERTLLHKAHYLLNTNLGAGLNQSGDAEVDERAIWGLHTGFCGLAGFDPFYLEIDFYPSTYFYRSTTFVNLNGWFGFRLINIIDGSFFVGLGYTPILYSTYSDPNQHYVDANFGLKLGASF